MHHHFIAVWISIASGLFVALAACGLAIYDDWKRRGVKKTYGQKRR